MALRQEHLALPADVLAFELLPMLPRDRPFRRTTLINEVLGDLFPRGPGQHLLTPADRGARELAEALGSLETSGCLVQWPPQDAGYTHSGFADMFTLTRLGQQVRAQGDRGRDWLRARRRLGVDLHADLRARLEPLIAVGAFEQAALVALRAVEARVRRLAPDAVDGRGAGLVGVALMRKAFGQDGALADRAADPGERTGMMDLFAGTFGAVRNVIAHTEVEWSDATEAAEYVLLADLLMRILDGREAALG